ncbi:MAG: alpha/beta hydrolase [Propionibacteriales bacterium]|nr:alpha/beta hydrolase [Propionibacteriales bacterium]
MRRPIDVPVLQVNGAVDPAIRRSAIETSGRHVSGPLGDVVIHGAGHFPHEEASGEFNTTLLSWLSDGARAGIGWSV